VEPKDETLAKDETLGSIAHKGNTKHADERRFGVHIELMSGDKTANFPFNTEKLKEIKDDRTKHQNVRTLAETLLHFKDEPQKRKTTTRHIAKTADTLKSEGHLPKATTVKAPIFKKSDIIATTADIVDKNPGNKVGILNPANSTLIMGGFFVGAGALEEIIGRCSDLAFSYIQFALASGDITYKALSDNTIRPHYATGMEEGEAWFTDNIHFIKTPGKPTYNTLDKPFQAAVIGSTAPSYANLNAARSDPNNEKKIKGEIRAQLTTAIEKGVNIYVATAFGCGEFHNDPALVSQYYYDVLYNEGYAQFFEQIHFVIWDNANYNAFKTGYDAFISPPLEITSTGEEKTKDDNAFTPPPLEIISTGEKTSAWEDHKGKILTGICIGLAVVAAIITIALCFTPVGSPLVALLVLAGVAEIAMPFAAIVAATGAAFFGAAFVLSALVSTAIYLGTGGSQKEDIISEPKQQADNVVQPIATSQDEKQKKLGAEFDPVVDQKHGDSQKTTNVPEKTEKTPGDGKPPALNQ